jgi:predicted PurR-regulated permease PerM
MAGSVSPTRRADLVPDEGSAPVARGGAPAWLRSASDVTARLLIVAAGVVALFYALGYLRIVVLPVIVALLATTLLLPPVRWLRGRGVPGGLAAAAAMLGAILVVAAVFAAVAPSIANQGGDLGTGVEDGVREATRVLADEPFNLSRSEIDQRVDEAIDAVRKNQGSITHGVQTGAILVGELITGLIVAVLLTFFFLKEGDRMWRWILGLVAPRRRPAVDEVGTRVFAALAGYVRGIALVGLVDALLIGLALVILGVPLVVPLMLLTFVGAFLPLIGAFLAGLAAVLIALVSNGFVTALVVLGAVVLVQQIEGHVLYPALMSRTVHLHPVAIILALATGGVAAGVIGVFLAVPVAGSLAVVFDYVRSREPDPTPT